MSRLLVYPYILRSSCCPQVKTSSSGSTIGISSSSHYFSSMLHLCTKTSYKKLTTPPRIGTSPIRHLSTEVGDPSNSTSIDSSSSKTSSTDSVASTSSSHNYSTNTSNTNHHRFLQGEVLDFARDLRTIRPGDTIHVPYEITITESIHDFWHSAFHSQDRITTSTPFARKIGLQDRILPFSLVLFLTGSMTHADAAKVQVSYENVIYHWPCFAGDTFTKLFQVVSVKNTSDGNHTVIHFACQLVNQRGRVCMTAGKRLMFPFTVENANSPVVLSKFNDHERYMFRNHIVSQARTLLSIGSHSLKRLHTGHLILHRMNRSVSLTQSQQLASLARLTHERHFDVRKYDATCEILVPGGVVLGLTLSAGIVGFLIVSFVPFFRYGIVSLFWKTVSFSVSYDPYTASRDLHELLYEEISHANFVNSLHPGNVVGAFSYVTERNEAAHDLEFLEVVTIGVKNMDVQSDLEGIHIPMELFVGYEEHGSEALLPKHIERICKERCPLLSKKIVVHIKRKIVRQAPRKEIFLL